MAINYIGLNPLNQPQWFKERIILSDEIAIPASAGVGKVLTSDADGKATWQTVGSSGDDTIFLAAGDQTTTAATEQAITELVTPSLDANSRYIFWGVIFVGCNNTGGVKIAVTLPASASLKLGLISRIGSATAPLIQSILVPATLNGTAFCAQNTSGIQVQVMGEITIGATAGVAQFGFAAGTAGQTATIQQQGTQINYKKIV